MACKSLNFSVKKEKSKFLAGKHFEFLIWMTSPLKCKVGSNKMHLQTKLDLRARNMLPILYLFFRENYNNVTKVNKSNITSIFSQAGVMKNCEIIIEKIR